MELRHLRSFVNVAETKLFSMAATRCCVTQSAVSQHIRALEDELGCKLLIRTYTATIATMQKYAGLTEDQVNNQSYSLVLEHLERLSKENEEMEKLRKN